MAIVQYPYIVKVLTQVEASQDEETGDIIPGTESWDDYSYCRDEDGNGKMIKAVDGSDYLYSFLIQLPKSIEAIPAGTEVKVFDTDGNLRRFGKIVYSRKDQLHTRAWV